MPWHPPLAVEFRTRHKVGAQIGRNPIFTGLGDVTQGAAFPTFTPDLLARQRSGSRGNKPHLFSSWRITASMHPLPPWEVLDVSVAAHCYERNLPQDSILF